MSVLDTFNEIEAGATNLVDIHAEPTLADLFAETEVTWHAGDVAIIAGGDAVGSLPGRGSYVYKGIDQTTPGVTTANDFLHLTTPTDLVESVAGHTGTVLTSELETSLADSFISSDPGSVTSTNIADGAVTAAKMAPGSTPAEGIPTFTSPESSMKVTGLLYNNFDNNNAGRLIVTHNPNDNVAVTNEELTAAGIVVDAVLQLGSADTSRGVVTGFDTFSGGRIITLKSDGVNNLNVSLNPPQDISVITPAVERAEGDYVAHVDDMGEVTWAMDTGGGEASSVGTDGVDTAAIQNDAVTNPKIGPAAVDTTELAADAVDGTKIADNSIDSEHYVDGSIDPEHLADNAVTNAKVADDAIGLAELSATGIPSETTYLRGDNTWAEVAAGSGDAEGIPNLPLGTPVQIPSSSGVTFQDPGTLFTNTATTVRLSSTSSGAAGDTQVTNAGIVVGAVLQVGDSPASRGTITSLERPNNGFSTVVTATDGTWDATLTGSQNIYIVPAADDGNYLLTLASGEDPTWTASSIPDFSEDRVLPSSGVGSYSQVENPTQILINGTQAETAALGFVNGAVVQTGTNPNSRGTITDTNPVGNRTRLIASAGTWDDPLVAPQPLSIIGGTAEGNYVLNLDDGNTTWALAAAGPAAYANSVRATGNAAKEITLTPGYWSIKYTGAEGYAHINSGWDNVRGGQLSFPVVDDGGFWFWNPENTPNSFDFYASDGDLNNAFWQFSGVGWHESSRNPGIGVDGIIATTSFSMELIVADGDVVIRVATATTDNTAITGAGALAAVRIT